MPETADRPIARVTINPSTVSYHLVRASMLAVAGECFGLQGYHLAIGNIREGVVLSSLGVGLTILYVLSGLPIMRLLLAPTDAP